MTDPMDLHALADGELSHEEAQRLRESLKGDSQKSSEVDAILNLKDILASSSLRHDDEEAWRACVRRLDALDKNRRVEGFVGRYAWALCGLMFVFIFSSHFAMRSVEGDTARTADLARVFVGPAHPVSPETILQKQAYRDLLGSVGDSLDPNGIQVGIPAYGSVRGVPAARFPLRDRIGDLLLTRIDGIFTLQDTAPLPLNPELSAGMVDRKNLIVWHGGGRTYLLSGDRPINELGDVASRVLQGR